MSPLRIDPRFEPHVPAALRMNDALRQMGDLTPRLDTPEQVAQARVLPEMFAKQETVLPVLDRTVPGAAGERQARVVVPIDQPRAVVLDFHGGGFCLGWPEMKDAANARLARDAQVAVISVDYRLAPEDPFPAGPDDCYAAARWLVAHAKSEFGTETILLGGDSAGGNLAMLTALRLRENELLASVAGLLLTYGVYDLSGTPSSRNRPAQTLVLTSEASEMFHELYLPGHTEASLRDPAVSPLYADLAGLPPALLLAGTHDPLLDDSLFMTARLRAAGGHADLVVVPESPHGFASFPTPMAEEAELMAIEWVQAQLEPPRPA